MASEVEICNGGLQKLGAERITSLTENSVNARACNSVYQRLRDAELTEHPWNCAIKRAQLAADSTPPAFGKDNSFPLPSDYLRLVPRDPEDTFNDLDWQIEGRKIHTNDSAPLNVRFIYQVTDPNEMDSLLREVISARIALELCEELTQSNTKKESLKDDYERLIRKAKRTNAILNIAQQPPEDTWVTVRF